MLRGLDGEQKHSLLGVVCPATMRAAAMDFDDAYTHAAAVFGSEPERTLLDYRARIDPQRPVLDIGAGQGRNALILARAGIAVDALEPSQAAAEKLASRAEAEALPIDVHGEGFETFQGRAEGYAAVLAFGLIQLLDRQGVGRLVRRTADWLRLGGLAFVTAFSTDDPAYPRIAQSWRKTAERSYANAAGERRTYLLPGEIVDLYSGFEVLHLWEGLGPEHHHGDGQLERHGMIEAVLTKAP